MTVRRHHRVYKGRPTPYQPPEYISRKLLPPTSSMSSLPRIGSFALQHCILIFFFLLLYIPSLLCFLRPAQAERRGGWRATVGPEGRLTPGCCSLHSRLASFRFTRCDVIGWDSHCGVLNVVSSNCVAAMVLLRPPCPPPFVHGPVSHRNNISHLSVASQPVTRRESR